MAEYPSNFRYDAILKTLAWDGVEGAVEYEIQDQIEGSEEWHQTYLGPDTQCPFDKLPGVYYIKGQTKDTGGGGVGIWGPVERIVVQ